MFQCFDTLFTEIQNCFGFLANSELFRAKQKTDITQKFMVSRQAEKGQNADSTFFECIIGDVFRISEKTFNYFEKANVLSS
jgi:hypothetical protein